jgi:hypothetical protein
MQLPIIPYVFAIKKVIHGTMVSGRQPIAAVNHRSGGQRMVTAILIPAIFLYFYWLSLREIKQHDERWMEQSSILEEALIHGKVVEVHGHKERFYYHRFNHVLTLKIQSGNKMLSVRKVTPLTRSTSIPEVKVGETVTLYGNWKTGSFSISRIISHS